MIVELENIIGRRAAEDGWRLPEGQHACMFERGRSGFLPSLRQRAADRFAQHPPGSASFAVPAGVDCSVPVSHGCLEGRLCAPFAMSTSRASFTYELPTRVDG